MQLRFCVHCRGDARRHFLFASVVFVIVRRALYFPYLHQVSCFPHVSRVVMFLGVCMLLVFLVRLLDIVPLACLLVHSTSYAGLCLRARACVHAVAGRALCKHKKYFSQCRRRHAEAVVERQLSVSNIFFACP